MKRHHLLATAALLAAIALPASAGDPHGFLSNGSTLALRTYGKGAPVVIVAGGPGLDADYMTEVAQDVAAAGFEAVLPDLRGTGLSREAGNDLSMMSIAGSVADLEALRQSLGLDRLTLIGHSFGGGIIQAYAEAHPDRVARLVLLDSAGTDLQPAPDQAMALKWMERLSPAEKADYEAARAKGDDTAMKMKFRATIANPAKAEAFVAGLRPIAAPAAAKAISSDFRAHYQMTVRDPAFPVWVIYGERDWIRGWQSQLAQAYPRASIRLIADGGHFPWIDNPEETASALAAALH